MMKRRGWVRIKASEWESLNADLIDLRERVDKNAKLTDAWAEHAAECQRECNDSQAYIKNLEADLERVRAELVEYKRMCADEVQKRFELAEMLAKIMDFEDDEDGN